MDVVIVGEDVRFPFDRAGRTVEALEPTGRAEGINIAIRDRRRGPRAVAAEELLKDRSITVDPSLVPGVGVVANDGFVVAALLDRHHERADDGEPGVAAPTRLSPKLLRRPRGPIGIEPADGHDPIAVAVAVFRVVLGSGRGNRGGRGSCLPLGGAVGFQRQVVQRVPAEVHDRDQVTLKLNLADEGGLEKDDGGKDAQSPVPAHPRQEQQPNG